MNKKGFIQDFLFFGIMILILSIMFVSSVMLMGKVNEHIQDSDLAPGAKAISEEQISRFPKIFDNIFIMIFFVLALGIIAGYYIIQTHPALLFPIAIIFGFILIIIAIQGNVFNSFAENDAMSPTMADMPGMNFIMNNVLEIVVVLGFLGIIALFAKSGFT